MSTATEGRHRTGPIDLRDLTAERPVRVRPFVPPAPPVPEPKPVVPPLPLTEPLPLPVVPVKGPDPALLTTALRRPPVPRSRGLTGWLGRWWAAVFVVSVMTGACSFVVVAALLAQRGPDAVPAPSPVPSPSASWSPLPGACVLVGGGYCDGPGWF